NEAPRVVGHDTLPNHGPSAFKERHLHVCHWSTGGAYDMSRNAGINRDRSLNVPATMAMHHGAIKGLAWNCALFLKRHFIFTRRDVGKSESALLVGECTPLLISFPGQNTGARCRVWIV